jgi:hypothetical protein
MNSPLNHAISNLGDVVNMFSKLGGLCNLTGLAGDYDFQATILVEKYPGGLKEMAA